MTCFVNLVGAVGIEPTTPAVCWRLDRLKEGISKATIARDITALKSLLSSAVEHNLLTVNPLISRRKRRKSTAGEDNKRVRFLSDEEEKRLFQALDQREATKRGERKRYNAWLIARHRQPYPEIDETDFADFLKPIVLLALNTGCRRGELLMLDWKHVDLNNKRLTVAASTAKTSESRHIPLNSIALELLTRWKKQTCPKGEGLLFPNKVGKAMSNFQTSWENLLVDAKIENFHFHDCRHDFASKLVMAGVDLNTVRVLLGHSDLKMTLRYAHLAPAHLATEIEKLVVSK